jgi:hypothetical protein
MWQRGGGSGGNDIERSPCKALPGKPNETPWTPPLLPSRDDVSTFPTDVPSSPPQSCSPAALTARVTT